MKINEIFANIRKQKKITQPEVSSYLSVNDKEISAKAISSWERGTSQPNATQFVLLCKLYGIADLNIFFDIDTHDGFNAEGVRRLEEYAELLKRDNRFIKHPIIEKPKRLLPLYHLPVSAGHGEFLDSDHYELVEVDDNVPKEADYAVRISGDSMTPRFMSGQIVFVQNKYQLEDGRIGVFIFNGEGYCKKLVGNTLVSLNTGYEPIEISEYDDLRVCGEVLDVV